MSRVEAIKNILKNSDVLENEALKKYSFTKTGGNADILVRVKSEEDFQNIIKYSNDNDIDLTILGNGSNVLISDTGIRGIVVITSELNTITLSEDNILTCYAGTTLEELANFCIENSLTNLEFSCGIPGSVGGAIFMNAGAYGGEMKEVVQKVEVFTRNGEKKTYTNEEMQFSYRHSVIQETKEIISKVYFRMDKGNKEEIVAKVEDLNKQRSDKQPLEYPSCGSVFKRPVDHFAGQLIAEAGLKGYRIGGVEVSEKHAGFMVNIADGTAKDYEELIESVIEKVKEHSGVTLEREVRILGEHE